MTNRTVHLKVLLSMLAACSAGTAAQTPPADSKSPPPPRPAEKQPQPSLDDLLGITKPKPAQPKPADPQPGETKLLDPARTELDRKLASDAVAEDFVQAVALMRETSDRLTSAGDAGLETQRLQQEVLKHLDKLIDEAKKNQKSKQKQQQQQQQQDQDQQQNQEQQQSSQKQKPQQGQQESSATAQGGNVPKQNAQTKAPPAGASAAWGDLPPHVREALLQGFSDKFSATYEQMTQEYYKRLAEQKPAGVAAPLPAPAPVPTTAPAPPGGGR